MMVISQYTNITILAMLSTCLWIKMLALMTISVDKGGRVPCFCLMAQLGAVYAWAAQGCYGVQQWGQDAQNSACSLMIERVCLREDQIHEPKLVHNQHAKSHEETTIQVSHQLQCGPTETCTYLSESTIRLPYQFFFIIYQLLNPISYVSASIAYTNYIYKKNTIMKSYQHQHIPLCTKISERTNQIFNKAYRNKYKKQLEINATVIASFSLYKADSEDIDVVSVGFGTKSLPYTIAKEHRGKVIKDMHAQVLARRGLVKYLFDSLPKKTEQNHIFAWCDKKGKHYLRKQYQLILYVNQIFCGDCMIQQSQNLFSGARPLKYFLHKQIPQQKFLKHWLRTKPGRLDLPLQNRSLSLSCSDKVSVWNVLGVQGKKLFNYIIPVYIDMVVIETERKIEEKRVSEGISVCQRVRKMYGYDEGEVERRLFGMQIDGKLRKISSQFRRNQPMIHIVRPKKYEYSNTQKQEQEQIKNKENEGKKIQICGIITNQKTEWIGGKTGLPQGVSLKKIGKVSNFCSETLYKNYETNQQEQFKYHAIKDNIKTLFKQWTTDYKN